MTLTTHHGSVDKTSSPGWILLTIVLLGMLQGCAAPVAVAPGEQQLKKLLVLHKGDLSLGILPDAGGRVVMLTKGESGNLIDSDPKTWTRQYVQPEMTKLGYEELTPGLRGFTVWVAPQSQWWTQQDVVPQKRDLKSPWPPDPFIDSAPAPGPGSANANANANAKSSEAVMVLPESPITGLQITKRYELISPTQIQITIEAVNRRSSRVSWGLWSNMRVVPDAKIYLPRNSDKQVKMQLQLGSTGVPGPVPYFCNENWFSPDTAARPSDPCTTLETRISTNPDPVFVAHFVRGLVFIRRTQSADLHRLAPEHARVEINCTRGQTTADDLLEVQLHSPIIDYTTNHVERFVEIWQIEPYSGSNKSQEQMNYLDQLKSLQKP